MKRNLAITVAVAATLLAPLAWCDPDPEHGAEAEEHGEPQESSAPALAQPPEHLRDKLRVERVLVKGAGEKGVEIEVRYRIVNADGYAAHPKTTFIADEESRRLVPLTKLAKLFTPAPEAEAMAQPPAALTLWDAEGVIRPGHPVTVVVAGYGQRHVVPEVGPGFDPAATGAGSTGEESSPLASADATVTVQEARVVAAGHLLNVRFSSRGIKSLSSDPRLTYVENPVTGERHAVARVPRIGALAPKDLENVASSYMVIDNAGMRIKPGQRVTVVVSGVRQEGVLVTAEAGVASPAPGTETAERRIEEDGTDDDEE